MSVRRTGSFQKAANVIRMVLMFLDANVFAALMAAQTDAHTVINVEIITAAILSQSMG